MVQESVPRKRNLLYEMLLKLSGIEKRITLSEEDIKKEITEIKNKYLPFLAVLSNFFQTFMKDMHEHLRDNLNIDKIENKGIIEPIYQDFKKFELKDEGLKKEQARILDLLKNQIQLISGPKSIKKEIDQDTDQLLQYLLIHFNRIDKNLDKLLPIESSEHLNEFDTLVNEIEEILDILSNITEEDIEEISARIKSLNSKLKYKKALFSFAMITRGFKLNKISLLKFQTLLKRNIRAEIIRATIIWTLKTFGALTIEQIEEKTKIDSKELLANCFSLLDRKEISIRESKHEIKYDIIREYPKLYRFINKEIWNQKRNLDKLPILSRSLLNAILSIADVILEKVLKIGSETDKIYEEEIQPLSKSLNKLNKAIKPMGSLEDHKAQQDKIAALIELYSMFRVKMVHEKEPYLIERSEKETKQQQLDNFILTATKIDFERGLLLSILRKRGPLNIRDLAELSDIPQNIVVRHVLKLVKDKIITTKGMENDYYLYEIPRTLTVFERNFRDIYIPFVKLIQSYINLQKYDDIKLERIPQISNELNVMSDSLSKLLEIELDSKIKEVIQTQLERTNVILSGCLQLDEKLPKTRSRFDLTKLAMMSLPRIEEQYADLIEPQYLVGFGDIELDINKCLACASCQEICPESAVILTTEWDLPATLDMTEEDLGNLPENRRMLIQLIKKIAVKKPTRSIKLPKDTLGFGTIKYNPLLCIACRKCEERCPNSALSFQEFWNFPEIMKTLLEEG
ncbi:MAG: 4Fe-4S binding protein [Candidatus Helarchaeota archaeon]|nr:4Fe-4S binding protein [Candidatus Helarchaeota archaeon]